MKIHTKIMATTAMAGLLMVAMAGSSMALNVPGAISQQPLTGSTTSPTATISQQLLQAPVTSPALPIKQLLLGNQLCNQAYFDNLAGDGWSCSVGSSNGSSCSVKSINDGGSNDASNSCKYTCVKSDDAIKGKDGVWQLDASSTSDACRKPPKSKTKKS